MAKSKSTTRRTRRPKRDVVGNVSAALELRDHCRAYREQQRQLASVRPTIRRYFGRLVTLLIFGTAGLIVAAHAVGFTTH